MTVTQVHAKVAAALGQTDRCRELVDELALARGRYDDAVALLVDAAAQAKHIGNPFEAVAVRRLLERAHHGPGATSPPGPAMTGSVDSTTSR